MWYRWLPYNGLYYSWIDEYKKWCKRAFFNNRFHNFHPVMCGVVIHLLAETINKHVDMSNTRFYGSCPQMYILNYGLELLPVPPLHHMNIQLGIFCRAVSAFETGCPWRVWCFELITSKPKHQWIRSYMITSVFTSMSVSRTVFDELSAV